MNSLFLDGTERCNSKTYYYIKTINNHDDIALLVHDTTYRQNLKHSTKGVKSDNIFYHRAWDDMKKLEQLIGCGRIKRLIIDNHNVDLRGFDYYNMIMSDDEIREVVLTDLALGC